MNFLCVTCGTQFAATPEPPAGCPICQDERQYIGFEGQRWTTLEALRATHRNHFRTEEEGLLSLITEPSFAIGQRAFLITTPRGNVLWDCLSLLDDETVRHIRSLGGLTAIAISHPHYYSSMLEWSRAFEAPVLLHAADRRWVMRHGPELRFWEGDAQPLGEGLTLIRCGGHFEGGAVLHWAAGAEGRGVLLSGDIIQVVPDRRFVSFMYSYPNLIPLSPGKVKGIVETVDPYAFDCLYGAFAHRTVQEDAKAAVKRSAERYIAALEGRH